MDGSDSSTASRANERYPQESNMVWCKNVYIWDMDETLILLKSLLDGTYAKAMNGLKDSRKGMEIGKLWENYILQVCDECFFYEQIENYNEPFLSAVSKYDDGRDLSDYDFENDGFGYPHDDINRRKVAYRHRMIAEKYQKGLRCLLDESMLRRWDELYERTDAYTDRWLSSAHLLLQQILSRNEKSASDNAPVEISSDSAEKKCENINVLVTSGSLIPSLAKCLLFRLDDVIPHDNVYSSWDVGKLQCFKWMKERFSGKGVRFCVVGDGLEECLAAERMDWPFIKVELDPNGVHRFPSLSMRMIENYMEVVYGSAAADYNVHHVQN